MFRVVATDAQEGWVEIQSFDGEVEQLSDEEWRALKIELCDAPEDWTGPFDDVERDDLGDTEADLTERDWRAPLDSAGAAPEAWEDATPADERDEWDEGKPQEPYVEEDEAVRQQLE
jgi:hypothetical protein